MNFIERDKLRHPYYKIMELDKEELLVELTSWSRLELIDWLCWNDKNGIYRDEESLSEVGVVLDKEIAIEIMSGQIHS
ncbi:MULTISPECIES: hypothetical protein [unclassified Olleya]|jgi:hypothetical protein|uniref:hypothetical protein n=1 Tax=unclassified Olleya TaxID=2615019 RepID=UPI0011A0A7D7|nr:hypothetical protein [Olleya sp. Hel_I_94]TVZ47662.1 hypothetical protein JM82_2279 [Olleya sp. Hel_I_94]